MIALRIAARRLRRAPTRVLLAAALGGGGLGASMLVANLGRGVYDRAIADAARSGPGHLTVLPAGARGIGDAEASFLDGGLAARLAALPGVEDALPRTAAEGLVGGPRATRAALLAGVDLEREAAANPALRARRGDAGPEAGGGVLLAAGLAASVGAAPGGTVALTIPLPGGGTAREELRVAAVLDPALDAVAPAVVYLDRRDLQRLAGTPGRLGAIAVLLRADGPAAARGAAAAVREIAAARPELRVATWEETLPMLRDAIALDRFGHRLLLAALLAVVSLGAALALAGSILDRAREHGLLLALGTPPAALRRIVLGEGVLLGAAALAVGLAAGSLATAVLASRGLDLRPLLGAEIAYGGVLVPLRVFAGWDWPETLVAAAAVFATHAAAALVAGAAASRRTPADALRSR